MVGNIEKVKEFVAAVGIKIDNPAVVILDGNKLDARKVKLIQEFVKLIQES